MKQEIEALTDSADINRQAIADILNKNEIVVLTRDEAKKNGQKT